MDKNKVDLLIKNKLISFINDVSEAENREVILALLDQYTAEIHLELIEYFTDDLFNAVRGNKNSMSFEDFNKKASKKTK